MCTRFPKGRRRSFTLSCTLIKTHVFFKAISNSKPHDKCTDVLTQTFWSLMLRSRSSPVQSVLRLGCEVWIHELTHGPWTFGLSEIANMVELERRPSTRRVTQHDITSSPRAPPPSRGPSSASSSVLTPSKPADYPEARPTRSPQTRSYPQSSSPSFHDHNHADQVGPPPHYPPTSIALLTRTRVRTLTGKEIELDIEPEYKVRPLRSCSAPTASAQATSCLAPAALRVHSQSARSYSEARRTTRGAEQESDKQRAAVANPSRQIDCTHQRARGGERGHPAGAAALDLWRQADVRRPSTNFYSLRWIERRRRKATTS